MCIRFSVLLLIIPAVCTSSAGATTLNYMGSVKITSSAFPSDISIGDVFTFSFSYDDSVQDTNGSVTAGGFNGALRSFTLERDPRNTGVWDPAGGRFALSDLLTFANLQLVIFPVGSGPTGGGFPPLGGSRFNALDLRFSGVDITDGGSGTTLAQQLGGPFPSSLAAFSSTSFDIQGNGFASGVITSFSGPQPLRFVPITPCRIADTRKTAGDFGGPSIAGGGSRDFNIPASACGVPSTAQAYSLNVAVVPLGPLGYLTLWPAGQTMPVASTVNSLDGRIKSNAAIVPAGAVGAVSVFASNSTDVVLDINGYFVSAADPTALAFYPITPCRIADTRKAALGLLGTPSMAGQESRTFPVLSGTCNIPATAQAYSLNFTAVPPAPLGYLTTWPTGQAKPQASSLNAITGTVTANAAIVPAGTSGSIDVFASNPTDVVIDINGYFAPMVTGGLSLYGVTPCRLLDTRKPAGSPPVTSLDVAVSASACGIPANAQAHVFSVTVVPPAPLGYLTLWPQGQTRPTVSTLNAVDGAITSNLAIVPTTNGSISAFASNLTHLILDISAYFGQ